MIIVLCSIVALAGLVFVCCGRGGLERPLGVMLLVLALLGFLHMVVGLF